MTLTVKSFFLLEENDQSFVNPLFFLQDQSVQRTLIAIGAFVTLSILFALTNTFIFSYGPIVTIFPSSKPSAHEYVRRYSDSISRINDCENDNVDNNALGGIDEDSRSNIGRFDDYGESDEEEKYSYESQEDGVNSTITDRSYISEYCTGGNNNGIEARNKLVLSTSLHGTSSETTNPWHATLVSVSVSGTSSTNNEMILNKQHTTTTAVVDISSQHSPFLDVLNHIALHQRFPTL